MIRKSQEAVQWLEFDLLAGQPGFVHGTFLRHGGVSTGAFSSLNAGGGMQDAVENVIENRARMQRALQIPYAAEGNQVHGDRIVWIQEKNQAIGDCDGLITDRKEIGLMIKHADCQATILYDPIHRALANVHCGWRGNVKNIYRVVIQTMAQSFGTKPADLLVGISPSLGPEHAEFIHYKVEFPEEFWSFQVKPNYFDLWAIARYQLQNCGVLPHHIEIASLCTYANREDYYSYRRDKIKGNHATYAMLA